MQPLTPRSRVTGRKLSNHCVHGRSVAAKNKSLDPGLARRWKHPICIASRGVGSWPSSASGRPTGVPSASRRIVSAPPKPPYPPSPSGAHGMFCCQTPSRPLLAPRSPTARRRSVFFSFIQSFNSLHSFPASAKGRCYDAIRGHPRLPTLPIPQSPNPTPSPSPEPPSPSHATRSSGLTTYARSPNSSIVAPARPLPSPDRSLPSLSKGLHASAHRRP